MTSKKIAAGQHCMPTPRQLLIFTIDGKKYAIHLQAVERVVLAVEITPLPEEMTMVTGVINVQGQVVPIFNIRRKLRLPERAIDLDDNIVMVKGEKGVVAFVVDAVTGVIERREEEIIPAGGILPEMEYTEGAITIDDDIVFLHNIDKALSFEEKIQLTTALEKGSAVPDN
ncbi:MAG: chemotaxis protein CheW [Proteobacteria bacterium]|nr:chemotaxis protein CheW [Pseudomonadota bacterium]MBU1648715.1 chemotaxis protein CheW [Pseudomonadota bacterium]